MSARLWKRLFARLAVWVILAGLFLLLLVVANSTWHVYQKQREAAHEYNLQAEVLSNLEIRNESLNQKLSALDTDRGVEEELRERFAVAKPGEEVIVLVDAKESAVDATAQPRQSIWQVFLGWFLR